MILQSLHDLYNRLHDDPAYLVPPAGYSAQKIAFKIVISPRGELLGVQDARDHSGDRPVPRQQIVPGDTKKSGSGLNPGLLWDNSGYMLGYRPDDGSPERTARTFEAFRKRHLELEDAIESAAFSAVCRFLESWDPQAATEQPVLGEMGTGFGVFQISGQTAYVHEDPAVAVWWGRQASPGAGGMGQCLVTGQLGPIASTHPKLKGVSGAQSAGAAIVSFNENAYTSYGRIQSQNAPVSEDAAFRYSSALNALLNGPMSRKHRLVLGDVTVAFWTARPCVTEDIFARFASGGSRVLALEETQDESIRQKLEGFLKALRSGREAYAEMEEDPEKTAFFLLGLSPNAGRIAVRFFHRGTLSDLLENLRRHYRDICMARRSGRRRGRPDPEFPPAWTLLRQTARESKEIPPMLAGPLLTAIVTGARYPQGLYSAVLRRIHADREVNYERACVIKGFLSRNLGMEVCMSLDTKRLDPAYRMGRLFSALEKTQRDALGESIGATVRDRFYSSASATPRAVFPRLLRTYQHHLAKLEGGRKVVRERLVQEILDPVDNLPAHLDLSGQGLFALGYYHQTQDFYTPREAPATEARERTEE